MARYQVLRSDVLIDYLWGFAPGSLARKATRGLTRLHHRDRGSASELTLGRSVATRTEPVLALLEEVRDAMQAGICLEAKLPSATRNRSHFERVPDLEVVAPAEWMASLPDD